MARQRRPLSATVRVVILVAVASLLSAGLGLAAGWFVRSPAQVAADTAPPERSLLTAQVTEGPIDDPLLVTGTVSPGGVREFSPVPPADVVAVVTKLPVPVGQSVRAGSVLIEVSDRPVIYLTAAIPMIRDLRMGDTGPDVARLQEALSAWDAPPADGVFGPGTARALRTMYEAAGYMAPDDSPALRSELVFGPSETATVVGVGSSLGAPIASPLIRVTTSAPTISAAVSEPIAQQLSIGLKVTVTGAGIGGSVAGKVTSIAGLTKSEDGAYRVPIQVSADVVLPPGAISKTVEISVATDSKASVGLLVPLSAVRSDAHNGTFVELVHGTKATRVMVTVVATGGGQAQVTAAGGALAVGDMIAVGSG